MNKGTITGIIYCVVSYDPKRNPILCIELTNGRIISLNINIILFN